MTTKRLYLVHAIDTEGPLTQSLKATVLRVNELFGTDFDTEMDHGAMCELVGRLERGEEEVSDKEEVKRLLATINFLSSRAAYAEALRAAGDEVFRRKLADPEGNPYRYSWFVLDNTATFINPRRRLVGYGQVYHCLRESLPTPVSFDLDGFYWHYHQMRRDQHPFVKEASFFSSDEYEQILCHRIIESRDFPAAYRAGYCLERWDANLWLENWIPFDYSLHSINFEFSMHKRIARENDFWLRAPADWSHYHPDSHDVERPGNLKRTLFRSLCVNTRLYSLDESEVRRAFERADRGEPTVVSGFSHDFRAIAPEAEKLFELVSRVSRDFPEVQWRNATAVEAAAGALGRDDDEPLQFSMRVEDDVLYVTSNQPVFGSEPFLAVKTVDHRFYQQNFVRVGDTAWGTPLRHPEIIHYLGVGACTAAGSTATALLERTNGTFVNVEGKGYWSGSPE